MPIAADPLLRTAVASVGAGGCVGARRGTNTLPVVDAAPAPPPEDEDPPPPAVPPRLDLDALRGLALPGRCADALPGRMVDGAPLDWAPPPFRPFAMAVEGEAVPFDGAAAVLPRNRFEGFPAGP